MLDDDEKGLRIMHTPGGQQSMWTVNEYGLYSLVLGSRKSEAKASSVPTERPYGSLSCGRSDVCSVDL